MKKIEMITGTFNNRDCNDPMKFYKLPQDEQEKIKLWIEEHVKPYVIKTHYTRNTSYSIKHDYEYHTGKYYVNGVFKGALHACGLNIENYHDLNWLVPLSAKYDKYRRNVLRKM